MRFRCHCLQVVLTYAAIPLFTICFSFGSLSAEVQFASSADCLPIVSALTFDSSAPVWTDDLAASLPLKLRGPFNAELLEESLSRLTARKVFLSVDAEVERAECEVRVRFTLKPHRVVAKIRFAGARALDEQRLRRVLRIREGEMLDNESLRGAEERIRKLYYDEGYSEVRVALNHTETAPGDVTLWVNITEGEPTRIGSLTIRGEFPPEGKTLRDLVERYYIGKIASVSAVKGVIRDLVVGLRREGYLQASAHVISSIYQAESNTIRLEVGVSPKAPLTIAFQGNTLFSSEELLAPLDLEGRMVPFSPNALQSLLEGIVELYEEKGYYFAAAMLGEMRREGAREIYPVIITEGPRVRLRRISFVGNRSVTDTVLLGLMQTQPERPWRDWLSSGIPLRRRVLSTDLAEIAAYYKSAGFPNTVVRSEVEREGKDGLVLTIFIDEGRRAEIQEIELVLYGVFTEGGLELLPLLYPMTIAVGAPLDSGSLERERERIEETARGEGFPNVTVKLTVDEREERVRFDVRPGVQVRLGETVLAGNLATRDRVIRRAILLHPGEFWNVKKMRESEEALFRTGLFSAVSFAPRDGALDEAVEDLEVRVKERETGAIDLGISYNTDEGIHIAGELSQRNFRGEGESIAAGLDTFFSAKRDFFSSGQFKTVYVNPDFFGDKLDLIADVFALRDIELIDQYSSDRFGGSLFVRHIFSDELRGTVGMHVMSDRTFDVEEGVAIGDRDAGTTLYNFVRGDVDWDRRNDVFNPTAGFRMLFEVRATSDDIGADVNLISGAVSSSFYSTLIERFVAANRLRFAVARPFGDTETIPLSQRFFLGGRNTLRGFGVGEVGPRSGVTGEIVGGDALLNLSTELQYGFTENFSGLVFLDAGQAFLESKGSFQGDNRELFDFRFTPGVGIRYRTPVGPLSAEYGIVLDRETGERAGRFNFGLGGAI